MSPHLRIKHGAAGRHVRLCSAITKRGPTVSAGASSVWSTNPPGMAAVGCDRLGSLGSGLYGWGLRTLDSTTLTTALPKV